MLALQHDDDDDLPNLEDLPGAMNNRDRCQESVREIRDSSET